MPLVKQKRAQMDPARQERVQLMALMIWRLGVRKMDVAQRCGFPSWTSLVNGKRAASAYTEERLLDLLRVAVNNAIATLQDLTVVGNRYGAEADLVARCRDIAARPLSILAHQVGTELARVADTALDYARCMANIDPEARAQMEREGRQLWRLPTEDEERELEKRYGSWGSMIPTPPASE